MRLWLEDGRAARVVSVAIIALMKRVRKRDSEQDYATRYVYMSNNGFETRELEERVERVRQARERQRVLHVWMVRCIIVSYLIGFQGCLPIGRYSVFRH